MEEVFNAIEERNVEGVHAGCNGGSEGVDRELEGKKKI